MVSSTTPKLAPKCPSLVAIILIIKARNSLASWGRSACFRSRRSLGEFMVFKIVFCTKQKYENEFVFLLL